jgi:hypothetical protein
VRLSEHLQLLALPRLNSVLIASDWMKLLIGKRRSFSCLPVRHPCSTFFRKNVPENVHGYQISSIIRRIWPVLPIFDLFLQINVTIQ